MTDNFPEFYQDETVVWRQTFYSDEFRSSRVDPATVEFKIKRPSGTTDAGSVQNEPGVGEYSCSFVVDEFGVWGWHWKTDTPRIVKQGFIRVLPRNVD